MPAFVFDLLAKEEIRVVGSNRRTAMIAPAMRVAGNANNITVPVRHDLAAPLIPRHHRVHRPVGGNANILNVLLHAFVGAGKTVSNPGNGIRSSRQKTRNQTEGYDKRQNRTKDPIELHDTLLVKARGFTP